MTNKAKGGVEGLIGYVRRNYMVPVPQADSLEALNAQLLEQCLSYGDHRIAGRQHSVNELHEQEKRHLIALPPLAFSNMQILSGKVDKYSTVIVDKNRYSVPSRYAGLKVQVLLYINRVDIFRGSQKIGSHQRLYGNNKWSLNPLHYLELIAQRPQSFEAARPIRQWRPSWPACLEELLQRFCQKQGRSKGIKDFISVLMLYKEYKTDDIAAAVEQALVANVSSSQAVEHILLSSSAQPSLSFRTLDNWQSMPPADVSVYRQIGGGS